MQRWLLLYCPLIVVSTTMSKLYLIETKGENTGSGVHDNPIPRSKGADYSEGEEASGASEASDASVVSVDYRFVDPEVMLKVKLEEETRRKNLSENGNITTESGSTSNLVDLTLSTGAPVDLIDLGVTKGKLNGNTLANNRSSSNSNSNNSSSSSNSSSDSSKTTLLSPWGYLIVGKGKKSWEEARAACREHYSKLMGAFNPEINQFIAQHFQFPLWLSGKKEAGNGSWFWVDGSVGYPMKWDFWSPGNASAVMDKVGNNATEKLPHFINESGSFMSARSGKIKSKESPGKIAPKLDAKINETGSDYSVTEEAGDGTADATASTQKNSAVDDDMGKTTVGAVETTVGAVETTVGAAVPGKKIPEGGKDLHGNKPDGGKAGHNEPKPKKEHDGKPSKISATIKPIGKTTTSNKKTTKSNGKTTRPVGKTTKSTGNKISEAWMGKTTKSNGKTTKSIGKTTKPVGKATKPIGKTTKPMGKPTSKPSKTSSPTKSSKTYTTTKKSSRTSRQPTPKGPEATTVVQPVKGVDSEPGLEASTHKCLLINPAGKEPGSWAMADCSEQQQFLCGVYARPTY